MVRTSGGIRISAGKSSKKSGGGGTSGGGSRSTSTPSGKSSGSTRLPPIPHCEAPSWQKPITNFFTSGAGPSKNKDVEIGQNEEKLGSSSKNEDTGKSVNGKIYKSGISEKDNANDDQSYGEGNEEDNSKENFDENSSN